MAKEIVIFGAGLSGLIAARMLHEHNVWVAERQSSLPNNHSALLRFRSSVVGDVTNIPFREVTVSKAVVGGLNPVADAVRYSLKVSGRISERSILDTKPSKRFISPPDLVSRLASTAQIAYDIDFEEWTNNLIKADRPAVISTLPMPFMMKLFGWKDIPDFKYSSGWTVRMNLKPELQSSVNCTVYAPGKEPWYRASINDDKVIFEGVSSGSNSEAYLKALEECFDRFAIGGQVEPLGLAASNVDIDSVVVKASNYQKISDLSKEEAESAKRFVMELSQKHGVYSLGRFATWRPKLMLDDIVNDVRIIKRLIDGNSHYNEVVGK